MIDISSQKEKGKKGKKRGDIGPNDAVQTSCPTHRARVIICTEIWEGEAKTRQKPPPLTLQTLDLGTSIINAQMDIIDAIKIKPKKKKKKKKEKGPSYKTPYIARRLGGMHHRPSARIAIDFLKTMEHTEAQGRNTVKVTVTIHLLITLVRIERRERFRSYTVHHHALRTQFLDLFNGQQDQPLHDDRVIVRTGGNNGR